MNLEACYLGRSMQMGTLAIVRPPNADDQELVLRLREGFEDASYTVAVYSPPELCALSPEDLHGTTLFVVSPGQCIEASGDETVFLSKVARAHRRVLASVGPVGSPWYTRRLSKGIDFDAVFDLGFASQADRHAEVSEVPYHFVFNGLTREEEPVAEEPAHPKKRTIPWVLIGRKNDKYHDLLTELLAQGDPGGFCLLQGRSSSHAAATSVLGDQGLPAVLSKARFFLWGADRDVAYYESFRFIDPLLAGMVPCKIDPDFAAGGLEIPGIFHSVAAFEAEARDEGYSAMYRRAREFYVSKGRLADHLSEAMRLV